MPDRSPCLAHRCHVCCLDTEMPLTNEDVKRIRDRTGWGSMRFTEPDPVSGWLLLLNIDGRCIFLDESGLCDIYEIRPEGCHYYPFILYDGDRVLEDEECPYGEEFRRNNAVVRNVKALVRKLDDEGENGKERGEGGTALREIAPGNCTKGNGTGERH